MEYPRVAFRTCSGPPTSTILRRTRDDGSIFEQMMDDFGEFEGDDSLDDE